MRAIVSGWCVTTGKRVPASACHRVQQVAQPFHIGIIQRRVHLVQHADRRGMAAEDSEDEGQRRQRLLAARQQRQGGRFPSPAVRRRSRSPASSGSSLPTRARCARPPPNRRVKRARNSASTFSKAALQTLSPLAIEMADRPAQLGDGGGYLFTLSIQGGKPRVLPPPTRLPPRRFTAPSCSRSRAAAARSGGERAPRRRPRGLRRAGASSTPSPQAFGDAGAGVLGAGAGSFSRAASAFHLRLSRAAAKAASAARRASAASRAVRSLAAARAASACRQAASASARARSAARPKPSSSSGASAAAPPGRRRRRQGGRRDRRAAPRPRHGGASRPRVRQAGHGGDRRCGRPRHSRVATSARAAVSRPGGQRPGWRGRRGRPRRGRTGPAPPPPLPRPPPAPRRLPSLPQQGGPAGAPGRPTAPPPWRRGRPAGLPPPVRPEARASALRRAAAPLLRRGGRQEGRPPPLRARPALRGSGLGAIKAGFRRAQGIALLQPHRARAGGAGGADLSVPPPHRPLFRDEDLPRAQGGLQRCPVHAGAEQPDLRQGTRQRRRRLDQAREGNRPVRQWRRRVVGRQGCPEAGGAGGQRQFQPLAQGSAQRGL